MSQDKCDEIREIYKGIISKINENESDDGAMNPQILIKGMLLGFTLDFIDYAKDCGIELDMTKATLDDIDKAIVDIYPILVSEMESEEEDKQDLAAIKLAKMVGSYFSMLIIWEDDLKVISDFEPDKGPIIKWDSNRGILTWNYYYKEIITSLKSEKTFAFPMGKSTELYNLIVENLENTDTTSNVLAEFEEQSIHISNMCLETNIIEKLQIKNTENQANELILKVKEYLNKIFTIQGSESIDIRLLQITLDGDTKVLEDVGGGFGMEIDIPEEISDALSKMEGAKEVSIFADYTCMKHTGSEFGYGYFTKILCDGMQEFTSYKCIENYDVDPEVTAYRFGIYNGVPVNELAPQSSDLSIVERVESWYDGNFKVEVTIPENFDKQEEIEELMETFAHKYNGEFEYGDIINEEIYYELDFTLIIDNNKVKEVVEELNKIAEIVHDKGGDFALQSAFIQDDAPGFCALWLILEEGKVVAKAVNMNGDDEKFLQEIRKYKDIKKDIDLFLRIKFQNNDDIDTEVGQEIIEILDDFKEMFDMNYDLTDDQKIIKVKHTIIGNKQIVNFIDTGLSIIINNAKDLEAQIELVSDSIPSDGLAFSIFNNLN